MKREIWMGSAGLIAGLAAGWIAAHHRTPEVRVSNGLTPLATARAEHESGGAPHLPVPSTERGEAPLNPRAWLTAWIARGAPRDELCSAFEQLEAWSQTDARAALSFAADASRFPERNGAYARPLAVLVLQDVEFVRGWLRTNLAEGERNEVAFAVIRAIADATPDAALALAETPDLDVPSYAFSRILEQLARRAPTAALTAFFRRTPEQQSSCAAGFVNGWASADFPGALAWCHGNDVRDFRAIALRGLLDAAVARSPEEADRVLREFPELREQLRRNPHQAWDGNAEHRLVLLPYLEPRDRKVALAELLEQELPVDPAQAIQMARELLPAGEADEAITAAWQSWVNSDRKAAHAWRESQGDGELQTSLEACARKTFARCEPEKFLAEVPRLPVDPEERANVFTALNHLIYVDARAASTWLSANPAALSPGLVDRFTRRLLATDESSAAAWAAGLPAGALQDRACAQLGSSLAHRGETALAASAIESIADPECRLAVRTRICLAFLQEDSDRARAWIESQALDPAVRALWISLAKQRSYLDSD